MKDKIILTGVLILATVLRQNISWSLLFSVISVAAIWYLVEQFFPKQKLLKALSAFFLAISPWHIRLVMQSLETNLAILLAIIGTLILMKVFKNGKWLYISVTLFILIINQTYIPLKINLINAQDVVWLTDQQRREHREGYNGFAALAFHNKAVNYSLSLLEHWGEHFSGDFLFIVGDTNLANKDGDFGQMYLFDIVFLFVGILAVAREFEWRRWGVILLWLIVAPINSALSFSPPDSLRLALMVVPLVIISGLGAVSLSRAICRNLKGCTIER